MNELCHVVACLLPKALWMLFFLGILYVCDKYDR